MTLALIDGDIVAYRAASSCSPTKTKPEEEGLDVALYRVHDLMQRILKETEATEYQVWLGGDTNYRTTIDPEYKANRKDLVRPTWLQQCRELLVTDYNARITDGNETDDQLGIIQSNNENTIICSIDKDLLQIPGEHYNFVKQEKIVISEADGNYNFMCQLIMGDKTDNVMGFDGKARPKIPQFLQHHFDWLFAHRDSYQMMLDYMKDLYNDDERLLKNGQLLWIQREEGQLWAM